MRPPQIRFLSQPAGSSVLGFDLPARRADPQGYIAVVVTALTGVLLTVAVLAHGYHAGFSQLNGWGAAMPQTLLHSLSYAGDSLFALAFMLIFARRHPQLLWTCVLAAIIATLISHGLKQYVDALRPPAVLTPDAFHLSGPRYRRNSFPSGHSTTAFVVACSFVAYLRQGWLRVLALATASAIACSRVFVGAHWPADVAAGAALGAGSVLLALRAADRWHWGLRPLGHTLLVCLLAACAAGLILRAPPYPAAHNLARGVGLAALIAFLMDYGFLPRRLLRAAAAR